MEGEGWQISEVVALLGMGPFPADWLLPHLREAASGSTWPADAPDGLLAVLEGPGFDLAVELLLGPGSFARVLGALEDSEE